MGEGGRWRWETLSEQDTLCTPWLTINICFVFPMPTRGTYSPERETGPGTGRSAAPTGYLLLQMKAGKKREGGKKEIKDF